MRSGFALVVGLALALPPHADADVRITMKDGLVTVAANAATVREILAEWARVGQTRIVNAERISGGPLTIQLTNMPEAQALDIVLRSVSGYLAAPREEMNPALSRFDRILVLPTSTPPRNPPPAAAPPPPAQGAPFSPPPFAPPPDVDEDRDDDRRQPPGPPARGGVFNPFPQQPPSVPTTPPTTAPPAAPASGVFGATPAGSPVGVAVPGMVVPAPVPQQPGPPPDQR